MFKYKTWEIDEHYGFFFLAGGKKVCLPVVGIHISLSKANKEI